MLILEKSFDNVSFITSWHLLNV